MIRTRTLPPSIEQKGRRKYEHGFTLVELLMVIGIMALVMAFVAPSFRGMGRSAAVNSAVAQLRTTISLARQWAITRNQTVLVVFADTNTWSATPSQPSEAWRAYRSFAVYAPSITNFIKEWTALPPGVVITPDTGSFPAGSGHDDNVLVNGVVTNVPFPAVTNQARPVRAVIFRPNGSARGSNNEIYLMEGIVETNGTIFLQTRGKKFSIEIQDLTGQVRVRDYNI